MQVEGVAAAILSDVSGIARHPYGNYAAGLEHELDKVAMPRSEVEDYPCVCPRSCRIYWSMALQLIDISWPRFCQIADEYVEREAPEPCRSSRRRSCPFARTPSGVQ